MSNFNDPYTYTSTSYAPRHQYHDSGEYNPYQQVAANLSRGNTQATVRTRQNTQQSIGSMYADEPPAVPDQNPRTRRLESSRTAVNFNSGGEGAVLGKVESRHSFTALTAQPGLMGDLASWRKEQHRNMWTRGSRGRCVGRFCCCTAMITILLIVSIILALVLWVRPPLVLFNGVQTATNGSTFEATTTGEFKINLGIPIFVANPNYFDATFSSISADITYPLNGQNLDVGGGTQNDITFKSHHNTNFTFAFSIVYDQSKDPGSALINDLVNRCGFIDPSTKQDLNIGYKITLKLKVLFATIAPSFSGNTHFACPVTKDEIAPFLSGLGINVNGTST